MSGIVIFIKETQSGGMLQIGGGGSPIWRPFGQCSYHFCIDNLKLWGLDGGWRKHNCLPAVVDHNLGFGILDWGLILEI